jgi:hemerythrin-like metal-binding protein
MSQILPIQWEPKYSVHVPIIDTQHRKLFDIVNGLIEDLESGAEDLLPPIRDMVDYLATHFHQEDIVMMEAQFPGYMKHKDDHQRFIRKVEDFLRAYQEGDKDLGTKMVLFMKDWLYNHTTKMDMLYADHLLKNAERLKRSGKIKLDF